MNQLNINERFVIDGLGVEMLVKLELWLVGLLNVVIVLDDIMCIVVVARLKAIILCCGHLGFGSRH